MTTAPLVVRAEPAATPLTIVSGARQTRTEAKEADVIGIPFDAGVAAAFVR